MVLDHQLPDGQSHFDWMFESAGNDESGLETWRCAIRPDHSSTGDRLELEALPSHRRCYLEYEGPVSANRGRVERVAQGEYRIVSGAGVSEDVREIRWHDGLGQRWLFASNTATCRSVHAASTGDELK